MPILFFILLIILIAQFGFWNTLSAVLGAVAMLVLLGIIIVALLAVGGYLAIKRMR